MFLQLRIPEKNRFRFFNIHFRSLISLQQQTGEDWKPTFLATQIPIKG